MTGALEARLLAVPLVRRAIVLDSTGSTNDDARRLGHEGAPEGTVVIARSQRAGRGRLGRTWHSPEGSGLYLSILLRPEGSLDRIGRYALVAALAALDACRESGAAAACIKWPNDVLLEGRKLAGILAELRAVPGGAELVLGFGVNVAESAGGFPADLAPIVGSLSGAAGRPVGLDDVALALLLALDAWVGRLRAGGWDEIRDAFVRYAPGVTGTRVTLASGRGGITRGLDGSGALRVETPEGMIVVHAGESVSSWEV